MKRSLLSQEKCKVSCLQQLEKYMKYVREITAYLIKNDFILNWISMIFKFKSELAVIHHSSEETVFQIEVILHY